MDREVTEEQLDEGATRLIARLERLERLTDGWLHPPKPEPIPVEEPPPVVEEDPDYETLKERWDAKRIADELAKRYG